MTKKRIHPLGVPLVCHLERAAQLLEVPVEDLGVAVARAQLQPWGRHASGADVFRWPDLLIAARDAGLPVPGRSGRLKWNGKPA